MDTRNKILTPAAALETLRGRPVVAVTAYFDVLRAEHADGLRRLREAAPDAALVALVLPCAEALLTLRARAELAAALAVIDYVVAVESGPPEDLLASLQPATVVRWEAADRARTRQLMQHVHSRQAR